MTSQRNLDIYQKRCGGATQTAVATEYGISGQRVRQIVDYVDRLLGKLEENGDLGPVTPPTPLTPLRLARRIG